MREPALLSLMRWGITLSTVIGLGGNHGAIAQTYPNCEPPEVGEYLLMVIHDRPDIETQLAQTLPRNATPVVCSYLGSVVSRVGGFSSIDSANAWAQYLNDMGGLQTFVARAAEEVSTTPESTAMDPAVAGAIAIPVITPTTSPAPTPSGATLLSPDASPSSPTLFPSPTTAVTRSITFNPQPLGAGYAVLVDYGNRPEVATDVQQLLSNPVGLVSYEQHPYLLATYTVDLAVAAGVMRLLGDRNVPVLIVDSRRAIVLTPRVANP